MSYVFWFCSAQLLIGLAFVLSTVFAARSKFSDKLRLHYQILLSLAVILIAQVLLPIYRTYSPLPKAWADSAQTLQNRFEAIPSAAPLHPLLFAHENQTSLFLARPNAMTLAFFGILLLWIGFKLFRDMRELSRIRGESFQVRKIGRVLILAHDSLSVPMTYWTPRSAIVIVPAKMLSDPHSYKISLLHELQHQRQRDPLWTLALEIFKTFSFANPLAKLWIRKINELQEFACDEALIGRSKVSSEQYARCLLQVAESALHAKRNPACATGLFFRMERYPLKRRIQMLLSMKKENRVAGKKFTENLAKSNCGCSPDWRCRLYEQGNRPKSDGSHDLKNSGTSHGFIPLPFRRITNCDQRSSLARTQFGFRIAREAANFQGCARANERRVSTENRWHAHPLRFAEGA
jgi:beta-lactamase regulating signal transducer with metallopeptidase domain